jgi:hypothetical protein
VRDPGQPQGVLPGADGTSTIIVTPVPPTVTLPVTSKAPESLTVAVTLWSALAVEACAVVAVMKVMGMIAAATQPATLTIFRRIFLTSLASDRWILSAKQSVWVRIIRASSPADIA